MLRAPEPGSYNLADFIATHRAELALDSDELNGPDEVLVPRLRALLEKLRDDERRGDRRVEAARVRDLRDGARWVGPQVVVLPHALFRLAAGAKGKKYIRLVGEEVDVAVSCRLLVRTGAALRVFADVVARVDLDGLHLSWRGGRGQLNLCPQRLKQPDDALVVTLPRRTVHRTMPALLGEILAELAFGT